MNLPTTEQERSIAPSMLDKPVMQVPLELKALNEDGIFAGYASVFDMVDSQRDIVMRGAFRDSIKHRTGQIKLLWQHHQKEPIGYLTRLFEDQHGLYIEGRLMLELAKAREAYALLKRGIISGLSIGYSPLRYKYHPESNTRSLYKVQLWEISLVTFPANEASRVSVVKSKHVAVDTEINALHLALQRASRILKTH